VRCCLFFGGWSCARTPIGTPHAGSEFGPCLFVENQGCRVVGDLVDFLIGLVYHILFVEISIEMLDRRSGGRSVD
jgi:hypothetical protein